MDTSVPWNLMTWNPAFFLLGLLVLALLAAFIWACAKI
jgi:hypothetical protein